MTNTDSDWEQWGKDNPYYGVLSDPKFDRESIDESALDAFFSTGREQIARDLQNVEKHFGAIRTGRALDFGCGVGRLSIPLSKIFSSIVATDISNSMLNEAEKNAKKYGSDNITWVISDDSLLNASGQFDLVYSYIALQHIPLERGMQIFERLIGKLAPGGIFLLHTSVGSGLLKDKIWKRIRYSFLGNIAVNFLKRRNLNLPVMQMSEYSSHEIFKFLLSKGIEDIVVRPELHGEALTIFWSGRIPSQQY